MVVRTMRESEVAEVSKLLQESYAWLGEREGLFSEQTEFLIRQRGSTECVARESSKQQYIVADDGHRIVGMVAVSGDEIAKFYVHPSRHGVGIGRDLFRAAETIIRAGGHTRVRLGAFSSAVGFYERMGLGVVGHKQVKGTLAGLTMTLMEKPLV